MKTKDKIGKKNFRKVREQFIVFLSIFTGIAKLTFDENAVTESISGLDESNSMVLKSPVATFPAKSVALIVR